MTVFDPSEIGETGADSSVSGGEIMASRAASMLGGSVLGARGEAWGTFLWRAVGWWDRGVWGAAGPRPSVYEYRAASCWGVVGQWDEGACGAAIRGTYGLMDGETSAMGEFRGISSQ